MAPGACREAVFLSGACETGGLQGGSKVMLAERQTGLLARIADHRKGRLDHPNTLGGPFVLLRMGLSRPVYCLSASDFSRAYHPSRESKLARRPGWEGRFAARQEAGAEGRTQFPTGRGYPRNGSGSAT